MDTPGPSAEQSPEPGPEQTAAVDPTPEVSPVKPLDVDGVNAAVAGTVAWFIAFLVLIIFLREPLAEHDATWWIWVCVAGTGLGLIGLPYVVRRRAVYRRHAAATNGG